MSAAMHQLLAGFRQGDAISDEALCLRKHFRAWGHESEILCDSRRIDPQSRSSVRDIADYLPVASDKDVVLLHLSIGSPVNEMFRRLPARKALLYHNITPSEGFGLISPAMAADLDAGRAQVASLAGVAEVNLADSAFNAAELNAAGYTDVRVLPLVLDLERFSGPYDIPLHRQLADGTLNMLFVGRCVPNKRIEDLLRVLRLLRRILPRRHSRLIHVGSHAGVEAYYTLLLAQARELGLRDVRFMGAVAQTELNACYRAATVFVCLSEHEGFCVPLMEAMAHGIPIVALDRAAVPETLDGAGVLITERDIPLIAETVAMIDADESLCAALIAGQQRRLDTYRARNVDDELRAHLAPLLD